MTEGGESVKAKNVIAMDFILEIFKADWKSEGIWKALWMKWGLNVDTMFSWTAKQAWTCKCWGLVWFKSSI